MAVSQKNVSRLIFTYPHSLLGFEIQDSRVLVTKWLRAVLILIKSLRESV